MTEQEFIAMVRQKAKEEGSQRKLARKIGFSETMLSDVLGGRMAPTPNFAEKFGLKLIRVYVSEEPIVTLQDRVAAIETSLRAAGITLYITENIHPAMG
jgi:hypothetical protein